MTVATPTLIKVANYVNGGWRQASTAEWLEVNNPATGEPLAQVPMSTAADVTAEALRDALLRQGVLVGVGGVYGNVIRFQPPLIITRQQIDRALKAFESALQEVAPLATV